MWIYINNLDQVIWLAENFKRVWHLNLFSRTKVKSVNIPSDMCDLRKFRSACTSAQSDQNLQWASFFFFFFLITKDEKFLHADKDDWSDCLDVQADLSLATHFFLTFTSFTLWWFSTSGFACWVKISAKNILKYFFFLIFPRKWNQTLHENRQFAWNVKSYFLGK